MQVPLTEPFLLYTNTVYTSMSLRLAEPVVSTSQFKGVLNYGIDHQTDG